MVAASSDSPIVSLIKKNSKMAKSSSDNRAPVGSIKSKVAVRFLLKRSKRFGEEFLPAMKRQEGENQREKSRKSEESVSPEDSLRERLSYLGLTPRQNVTTDRRSSSSKRKCQPPKKIEKTDDDFGFMRPRIFQCDYCPKIFFNKMVYRRHTIKHLRIRRCANCNQPFPTRISQRRHQANCKRIIN